MEEETQRQQKCGDVRKEENVCPAVRAHQLHDRFTVLLPHQSNIKSHHHRSARHCWRSFERDKDDCHCYKRYQDVCEKKATDE